MGKATESTPTRKLALACRQFDKSILLGSLAGLQLLPENSTHLVRLEHAVQAASSAPATGTGSPDTAALRSLLDHSTALQDVRHLEDPPDGLFTENIILDGKNFVVFPGIVEEATFILRHLFTALGQTGHIELSSTLRAESRSVLQLCNEVANRLRYSPWMTIPAPQGADIVVPAANRLRQLCSAVTFDQIACANGLAAFIVDHSERKLAAEPGESHLLFRKPIIRIGDKLVLGSPSALLAALRHRIITRHQEAGQLSTLVSHYCEAAAATLRELLRILGFALGSDNAPADYLYESIWDFDLDKAAYVILVADDLSNYQGDDPYGHWDASHVAEGIDERINTMVPRVLRTKGAKAKCLVMVVLAGMGRSAVFGLSAQPADSKVVLLGLDDLEVVVRQREFDHLTLWDFVVTRERCQGSTKLQSTSFLDAFAYYHSRGDSFNFGDDARPHFAALETGFGIHLREQAAHKWLVHATEGPEGRPIEVACRYDESIPIWVPASPFAASPWYMIGAPPCPIWVAPAGRQQQRLYYEFTETIAYWLWQLLPDLVPYLVRDGSGAVVLEFHLSPAEIWESGEPPSATLEAPQIGRVIDMGERHIELTLPSELRAWLCRDDNQAERLLVRELFLAFVALGRGAVDKTYADNVVDRVAPIGRKKKVHFFNSAREPMLNPNGLPHLRKLRGGLVDRQLEDLATDINEVIDPAIPVGSIPQQRYKEAFSAILQRYLQRLRAMMNTFSSKELLRYLIEQTEAVTVKVTMVNITAPSSAMCFRDAPRQAALNAEALNELNRTAIASRFLIELVAADRPGGRDTPSCTDYDEMLSIAYGYINWGVLGDEVRCRVNPHELSILPCGRIGVGLEYRNWMDPFQRVKALEEIEARTRSQELRGESTNQAAKWDVGEMDAAFAAEFGISMSQLLGVLVVLERIGVERGPACAEATVAEIKQALVVQADVSEEISSAAIRLLTLNRTKRWEDSETGFHTWEILPWRFNRRLSYIQRPLVGLHADGDPSDTAVLAWGPRHVHRAVMNLIYTVTSGRYRVEYCRSTEMRELRGRTILAQGKRFEATVANWFSANCAWRVEKGAQIGPGERLDSQDDLGDIDVLLIDEEHRIAYACECKDVDYGRVPTEISGEMDRLFRGDPKKPGELSRAQAHMRRLEWLEGHWKAVARELALASGAWTLVAVMILEEEIPSVLLGSVPLPVLAHTGLLRTGVAALTAVTSAKEFRQCRRGNLLVP